MGAVCPGNQAALSSLLNMTRIVAGVSKPERLMGYICQQVETRLSEVLFINYKSVLNL